MLAGRQEPSRLDEATDFLREVLADGPLPASEVKALATDEDITERTLKRARKKLGIASKREGFSAGASWTLPSIVILHSGQRKMRWGNWPEPTGSRMEGRGAENPCRTRVLPFGPTLEKNQSDNPIDPWPEWRSVSQRSERRQILPPFRRRSGLLVTPRRSLRTGVLGST